VASAGRSSDKSASAFGLAEHVRFPPGAPFDSRAIERSLNHIDEVLDALDLDIA